MKLSDVCEINPRSQAISDDTLVSFVAMPDVSEDGKINTSVVRPYGEVKKGYTVFQEGDILFAKITPCMENGKGALAVGLQNGIGVGSTEFHVLRPNTDFLEGMWLYYLTAWPTFRHEAEKHMTGSAGQKRVPKAFLERYQIEIPILNEQKHQVSQLSRIRRIIESRQRQLRTLDTLINARFVEMFDDGESPMKTVEELCSEIVDCPHTTPRYEGELKHPAIRTSEIKKGYIAWDTMRYVSDEEYEERVARLRPEKGDIVYGREGTFGNAAILPGGYSFCLGQRVMLLRPDYSKCTSEYLLHAVISDDVYRQAVEKNNASTVAHVNVKDVKQFKVPLPSFEKQKRFAYYVSQVDKSKAAVQAALDKTQLLFDSLMQQYFG